MTAIHLAYSRQTRAAAAPGSAADLPAHSSPQTTRPGPTFFSSISREPPFTNRISWELAPKDFFSHPWRKNKMAQKSVENLAKTGSVIAGKYLIDPVAVRADPDASFLWESPVYQAACPRRFGRRRKQPHFDLRVISSC